MMRPPLVDLCLPCNRSDKLICIRSLRKRVLTPPVIFVETLDMTTTTVSKKVTLNPKMFGKIQHQKEDLGNNVQIVMFHIWEYAHVHGASNRAILPKIAWHTLQILACRLGSPRKRG